MGRSDYYFDVEGRWMIFVDGENLTIRTEALAKECQATIRPGKSYERSVLIWPENVNGTMELKNMLRRATFPVRSYFYTCLCGDTDRVETIQNKLWELGFHPEVFRKQNHQTKGKGVDIALTKDMLSHAFHDNYDTAVLVAGDGDYLPLVEEVKRMGKNVSVAFLEGSGLSPKLKLASDSFIPLDDLFIRQNFHWPQVEAVKDALSKWIESNEMMLKANGHGISSPALDTALKVNLAYANEAKMLVTPNVLPPENPQLASLLNETGIFTSETNGLALPSGILVKPGCQEDPNLLHFLFLRSWEIGQSRASIHFMTDIIISSLRHGHEGCPQTQRIRKAMANS
jgi:uncharacterized LabA/DUF88 family protein